MTTLATTDDSYKDVYYFHRGYSAKGIYYGAKNTGTTWPYYRAMPGSEETNKGPAAFFFNNKLYVFYKGKDTNKIFYRSSDDGYGRLIIVFKGKDTLYLYQAYSYNASTWYGNTKITGESIAGPCLVKTTW